MLQSIIPLKEVINVSINILKGQNDLLNDPLDEMQNNILELIKNNKEFLF